LITVGLSAEVAATRAGVWSALADPAELAAWRPGLHAAPGTPTWPREGATLCSLARVHGLPLAVHETAVEAVAGERLHVRLRVGLFRCDATFTLAPLAGELAWERTRVGLQLQVANELPLVGGTLDRFSVRRIATELAAARLAALREACEARAGAPPPGAGPVAAPGR
jgi:Polyketide cyclase / dehydrase and lipid transport